MVRNYIIWTIIAILIATATTAEVYHASKLTLYEDFQSYAVGQLSNNSKWAITHTGDLEGTKTFSNITDENTEKELKLWIANQAGVGVKAIGNLTNVSGTNWTVVYDVVLHPVSGSPSSNVGKLSMKEGGDGAKEIAVDFRHSRANLYIHNKDVCFSVANIYQNDTLYRVNLTRINNGTTSQVVVSINNTIVCNNVTTTTWTTAPTQIELTGSLPSIAIFDNIKFTQNNGTCSDGIQNGDETSTDLGGACGTINPTHNITITILNDVGQVIPNVNTSIKTYNNSGYNTSINPFSINASLLVNITNQTVEHTFNLTDTDYTNVPLEQKVNISVHTTALTLNMTSNALVMYFRQRGVLYTVDGFIANNDNISEFFTDSSIVIKQSQLPTGEIQVYAGILNSSTQLMHNETNCYEYINNKSQAYTLNFEVPIFTENTPRYYMTFQIESIDGKRIENAKVNVKHAVYNSSAGGQIYRLLCQKLSSSNGIAKIFGAKDSYWLITITATGYEPKIIPLKLGETNYDEDNPFTVVMTPTDIGFVSNYLHISYDKYITNLSRMYNVTTIYETNKTYYRDIILTTDYRENRNLPRLTSTLSANWWSGTYTGTDIYSTRSAQSINRFSFDPNQYFNTSRENQTIIFYLDNTYLTNITVYYYNITLHDLSIEQQNLVPLAALLGITIIIISVFVGLIFKSNTAGFYVFIGLGLISPFIMAQYMWLGAVSGIYILGKYITKTVQTW